MARLSLIPLLALLTLAVALSVEPNSLRANAQLNPIAVDTATPRLTWRLTSSKRSDNQTAYQIHASSTSSFTSSTLWDTGKVSSADPWATYAGAALSSRSAVFWRVKVWDAAGAESSWSSTGAFEVSLLDRQDWGDAEWITNKAFATGTTSLPRFAKPFTVTCPVTQARLYILGLGLHYPLLNGVKVGDDVLSPAYATLNKTMPYSTYDVLDGLRLGRNVLAVELGKGIYDNTAPLLGRYTKFKQAARELMLLAQLEYTCEDGTVEKVATDSSWVTTVDGPWIEAHWYGGEEYDARKEVDGWAGVCHNRSSWVNASVTTPPAGKLVSPRSPPLKVTETIVAKSVRKASNGQWVFDLGTNIAGHFTLHIKNQGDKAGTRITFWPGEAAGADGVSQASSGSPIFDAYTLSSSDVQAYTPRYLYHGYQYLGVNLTWTPEASDLVGYVIRAANEPVLTLSTSDSLFNSIHGLVDRSIRGNMHSVLTDCPHREKYGWLEQDHLVFGPLTMGYDLEAYLDDLVRTIGDAQASDVPGLIPDIAPEYGNPMGGGYRNDPNWGSAVVLVPLKAYKQYGDISILTKKRKEMVEYVDYLVRRAGGKPYLNDGGLGDWLNLDTSTPKGAASTFGFHGAAQGMAEVEALLGNDAEAEKYAALAESLRQGFHGMWFNQTAGGNYYCTNSQGCNAFALGMGAAPGDTRDKVLASIIESLEKRNWAMTVGEISLPSLFEELHDAGRDDVLYNIMSNDKDWGYGRMVREGATSLWEHWDLPVTGGSRNHFMFGYADSWIIRLSGLAQREGSVAWREIEYAPIVVGDLTFAETRYRTPRGDVSAKWEKDGGRLHYEVVVPVGSTGWVVLPAVDVQEGGAALKSGEGVVSFEEKNGTTTILVGSGTFSFSGTLSDD